MSGVRYKSFSSSEQAQAWLQGIEDVMTTDVLDAERKFHVDNVYPW